MRIRMARDKAYRNDAIERAAEFYDCNKTKGVVSACDDVPELVAAARQVLERDYLTLEQRREIADMLSTRTVTFEIDDSFTTRTLGNE